MDPKKLGDLVGRFKSGGKGMGAGIGFLAASGALAYGLFQSMYTGISNLDNVVYTPTQNCLSIFEH